MKINLTKKQYEMLAKTVYLGNWMAAAWITGRSESPIAKKYDEIKDYIFSLAREFGFPESYEAELEFADNESDDNEVRELVDEYDNETFWQELPDRLGHRDFYRKYSKKEREKMNRDEHFEKLMECEIKWEEELEKNGIERLGIVEK